MNAQDYSLFFSPQSEWKWDEEGKRVRIPGTHDLSPDALVWIFLTDDIDHYYLQNPKVAFNGGQWRAANIQPNEGTNQILAIEVNKKGNEEIEGWVAQGRWGAIEEGEVMALGGYRPVGKYWEKIIFPIHVPPPPPPPGDTPENKRECIMIEDFNSGKEPLTSGDSIRKWASGTMLKTSVGLYPTGASDQGHAPFAAYVNFSPTSTKEAWSGGGMVINLSPDENGLNLCGFKYIQFDVKADAGSVLKGTKIKLESKGANQTPERLLAEFEAFPSEKWQRVCIPLSAFTEKRKKDGDEIVPLQCDQVTKFVTVTVQNATNKGIKGRLIVDNIFFSKEPGCIPQPPPPPENCPIKSFRFGKIDAKLLQTDTLPKKLTGTYELCEGENPTETYIWLGLVDEFYDGYFCQNRVRLKPDNTWVARIRPGPQIIGIVALHATSEKGVTKLSGLSSAVYKKILFHEILEYDIKVIEEFYLD